MDNNFFGFKRGLFHTAAAGRQSKYLSHEYIIGIHGLAMKGLANLATILRLVS
jgi:hypothetical protein